MDEVAALIIDAELLASLVHQGDASVAQPGGAKDPIEFLALSTFRGADGDHGVRSNGTRCLGLRKVVGDD
jgi:hypothetical protein